MLGCNNKTRLHSLEKDVSSMSSIGIEPHVITISSALIGNITMGGIVLWGIRISTEQGESNRSFCVSHYITIGGKVLLGICISPETGESNRCPQQHVILCISLHHFHHH